MTAAERRARVLINRMFRSYSLRVGAAARWSVLPAHLADGKLYEAWVLATIVEQLAVAEGLEVVLVAAKAIKLKTGGGPINPGYAHFELRRPGVAAPVAKLWTDIYVMTLSAEERGETPRTATACDYHELDLVIADPDAVRYPRHDEVWLVVECKDRRYEKSLFRELLGVRRELSFYSPAPEPTRFARWPASDVAADPASCLLAYSTNASINVFDRAASTFGIELHHLPLP